MQTSAQYWIEKLNLSKHPEGGYYKRTFCSFLTMNTNFASQETDDGKRASMTAIYYLIDHGNFSAFHRLKSEELWHFYTGDCLSILMLNENGTLETIILGNKEKDERAVFQVAIEANKWFAVGLIDELDVNAFALVGCTVSPGFDFRDFELGNRDILIKRYPQHADMITKYTR